MPDRSAELIALAPIAGVPGLGRWLVFDYQPTSLFSLKMAAATSSVGRSLLTPTPYAVKMAFVDAAFCIGRGETAPELLHALALSEVRVGVPRRAALTHTIMKIRQEPKKATPGAPYVSAIAYREFVHFRGRLRWAFDLARLANEAAELLVALSPYIHYIGKRGSFVQFQMVSRLAELGPEFTEPLVPGKPYESTRPGHIAVLDDFGPDANLDALNSYSDAPIKRDKHRRFVHTLVPLAVVNEGPGFTEYCGPG
ncbi:MAG TPA: hypothetical protein VMD29_05110 [Terracidiphilus sp.]|nr:hypothetical protein [Terracidiphilus sp.]